MTNKIEKTINEVTYQSIENNIEYLTSDFDKLYVDFRTGGDMSNYKNRLLDIMHHVTDIKEQLEVLQHLA